MVEYLLPNLKFEGSRPTCAQILFRYTAGKFQWRRKLNRKFRPTCQKLFCSMYEMSQQHPVWVAENYVTACNSEEIQIIGTERIALVRPTCSIFG